MTAMSERQRELRLGLACEAESGHACTETAEEEALRLYDHERALRDRKEDSKANVVRADGRRMTARMNGCRTQNARKWQGLSGSGTPHSIDLLWVICGQAAHTPYRSEGKGFLIMSIEMRRLCTRPIRLSLSNVR